MMGLAGTMAALLLTGAAADKAADTGGRTVESRDKVICKRFVETGSLVRGYRVCKPRRDWDWERDNIRANAFTSGSCASANSGSCNPSVGN